MNKCKPIKYKFKKPYQKIQETLSKTVEIQANTIDEALQIAQKSYQNEEIVLDWGDFILVEFDEFSD